MSRWIALAVSSLIAVAAAIFFLERRALDRADMTLVSPDVEGALAADREARAADPDADPAADPTRPWLAWNHYLPEEVARKLMPQIGGARSVYDPWCGFVYAPFQETGNNWVEHPDGKFDKRANSLGIQTEAEVREVKPKLRILVAGDSHVDGVCNQGETYPMLLGERLEATVSEGEVEVLNAAHGGYGIYNYLGTLERFVQLGFPPDVFVMTVFAGNDFTDSLMLWRFIAGRRGETVPARAENEGYLEHRRRQRAARGQTRFAYAQALGIVGYLRHLPGETAIVLDASLALTREAQARCDELGIAFLVVVLPAPAELMDQANRTLIEHGLDDAGLDAADIDLLSDVRERYMDALREDGIACVDLWDRFASHVGMLFWSRDLHLNLDGHRLAAEVVEGSLLGILGR